MCTFTELLDQYGIDYPFATEKINEPALCKLWTRDEIFETTNPTELEYIAFYYELVKPNDELMVKYCKLAIENGSINRIMYTILGNYYYNKADNLRCDIPNNLDNFETFMNEIQEIKEKSNNYYKIAAESGCVDSMIYLARNYENDEYYELAKKYYKMAADTGDENAIEELANYYTNYKKDLSPDYECIEGLLYCYNHGFYNDWVYFLKSLAQCKLSRNDLNLLQEHLLELSKKEEIDKLPSVIKLLRESLK